MHRHKNRPDAIVHCRSSGSVWNLLELAALPRMLQYAGMIGSMMVLLLVVLSFSGRFSSSMSGMPGHARLAHRRAAEISYSTGHAADELSTVLKAAQQEAAQDVVSAENLKDQASLEESPEGMQQSEVSNPGRLQLLEESPPSAAASSWSSISSETVDQYHAVNAGLPLLAQVDIEGGMHQGADDSTLKQELLKRNLERPQLHGMSDAFDGPWDQRYPMAPPGSASSASQPQQQGGLSQQQLQQQMSASHLKPGSIKRVLSGNEDDAFQQRANCPAAYDIGELEKLPFCHADLSTAGHPEHDTLAVASVTGGRDTSATAHGLPRAQARARSHKMMSVQAAARQPEDELETCAALLGVKKVALLFLTRGELYHTQLWSTWLESVAGKMHAML